MALHDVDKDNNDRSSPAVNGHDLAKGGRMAQGTTSLHPVTDANTIPGFLQTKNLRILANDGTTNRGLFGYNQAMGLWGFFLTKLGIDVNTNTDTSKFIFNSNQDVFKIIDSGLGTVTVTSGDTANDKRTTIAHGLSFVPIVIGFIQNPSGDIQLNSGEIQCPYGIYGDTLTGGHPTVLLPLLQYYYVGADATNIYLNVLSSDVLFYTQLQGTFTFKYYLLQETAN